MGDRTQIGFYYDKEDRMNEYQALIYRSTCDQEYFVNEVIPFLEWWAKSRRLNDPEYCAARLIQYLCNRDDAYRATWSKYTKEAVDNGFTGMVGFGVSSGIDAIPGDVTCFYRINPGEILVYKVDGKLPRSNSKPVQVLSFDASGMENL